jgi:hypothetical protein
MEQYMEWEDLRPSDLPLVLTEPMSPERRHFLAEKAREAIEGNPKIEDLQARLLAMGGEAAVFGVAPRLIELLLERGVVFPGEWRLYRRSSGRCHYNSARLWAAQPELRQLATGFALGDDGCWRPHSWVLQPAKGKPPVIETTIKRLLYYGLVLTPEEAEPFWERERDNW